MPDRPFTPTRWAACLLLPLLALLATPSLAQNSSSRVCARPTPLTAAQQDKLLQFGSLIRKELEGSGADLALIARSGTDLSRFDMRYSHAGVTLRNSDYAPWSVRQLYYDCDASVPRIFDQGLSGFLLDTDDPRSGFVSLVLLPPAAAAPLEQVALSNRRALGLLGDTYSANAYPFAQRYQNCNQWLAELLATAWGELPDGDDLRARAQAWLAAERYEPTRFTVHNPFVWIAGQFVTWLHNGDHPQQDLERMTYRVSMPASIEAFARHREPAARRVEFCHTDEHIVVRRGWSDIAPGCVPAPGDTVIALD